MLFFFAFSTCACPARDLLATTAAAGLSPANLALAKLLGQLALLIAAHFVLGRLARQGRNALQRAENAGAIRRRWLLMILLAVYPRLWAWLWICGLYTAATWHGRNWLGLEMHTAPAPWQDRFVSIITVLCALSLLGKTLSLTNRRLRALVASETSHWERLLGVVAGECLGIGLPLAAAYTLVPLLALSPGADTAIHRCLTVGTIGAVGFVLCRVVNLIANKVALHHADSDYASNEQVRTLFTQVSVLRKVALLFIGFLGFASMMMVFPVMRHFGMSLLASAGVIGVVAGVASQRSLANLVAGFQIALTQPILLDDTVTVEGEIGVIEEISLTYVVVRLLDLRRMILPISYFLEKPFQNWSRHDPQSVGFVSLPLDYTTPLAPLEREFDRVLASLPLWDGGNKAFFVFDTRDRVMDVRMTMSASDSARMRDLRSQVRRQMIEFVCREYPGALPAVLRTNLGSARENSRLRGYDGGGPTDGFLAGVSTLDETGQLSNPGNGSKP